MIGLDPGEPTERILKLPSLSAGKAFELLQPALQQHVKRAPTGHPSLQRYHPDL